MRQKSGTKRTYVPDTRKRFHIALTPKCYARITDIANKTKTCCIVVVLNLMHHYISHREEKYFMEFKGSRYSSRTVRLQLKIAEEKAGNWMTMGFMLGFGGRQRFIAIGSEAVLARFSDDDLVKLVNERADVAEAIELCLRA